LNEKRDIAPKLLAMTVEGLADYLAREIGSIAA
jgi:hypothetical protein